MAIVYVKLMMYIIPSGVFASLPHFSKTVHTFSGYIMGCGSSRSLPSTLEAPDPPPDTASTVASDPSDRVQSFGSGSITGSFPARVWEVPVAGESFPLSPSFTIEHTSKPRPEHQPTSSTPTFSSTLWKVPVAGESVGGLGSTHRQDVAVSKNFDHSRKSSALRLVEAANNHDTHAAELASAELELAEIEMLARVNGRRVAANSALDQERPTTTPIFQLTPLQTDQTDLAPESINDCCAAAAAAAVGDAEAALGAATDSVDDSPEPLAQPQPQKPYKPLFRESWTTQSNNQNPKTNQATSAESPRLEVLPAFRDKVVPLAVSKAVPEEVPQPHNGYGAGELLYR